MDLQNAIVGVVVLSAVAMLVRRVVGFVTPRRSGEPVCKSCASSKSACQPAKSATGAQPVMLYRPDAR